ncbi:restriction endonuclease fold toxin [Streptomyces rimosus]|uniref:restriction endonuclease fold toxin n=1 Tax=Streptomyces rimosus TaxID=1927 RepID=UPI003CD0218E
MVPPEGEFVVVSDKWVAQSKPAGFRVGNEFRNQAKVTFEAAIQSGRTPYFHFGGSPVSELQEYLKRYGVQADRRHFLIAAGLVNRRRGGVDELNDLLKHVAVRFRRAWDLLYKRSDDFVG